MNTQLNELFIAYGATAVAMLAGLLLMRADGRAYWRWPVYSAMCMVLGIVSWNLLRRHLIPPEWLLIHARTLYGCAIALYLLLGLALGLFVGRITRGNSSPNPEPAE
jgi:hypothetical protein